MSNFTINSSSPHRPSTTTAPHSETTAKINSFTRSSGKTESANKEVHEASGAGGEAGVDGGFKKRFNEITHHLFTRSEQPASTPPVLTPESPESERRALEAFQNRVGAGEFDPQFLSQQKP